MTSVVPTSLISVWHTAARRSLRSFNSSLMLCALKSWTLSMRRTLCPWPRSRDSAEIAKTRTCPVNPRPCGPTQHDTEETWGDSNSVVHPIYSINTANHHYRSMPHTDSYTPTKSQGHGSAQSSPALTLFHLTQHY